MPHRQETSFNSVNWKIFLPILNAFFTSAIGMVGFAIWLIPRDAANNPRLAENATNTWLTFMGATMGASYLAELANAGISKLPLYNHIKTKISVASYFSLLTAATIFLTRAYDPENNINYYPAAQLATGHAVFSFITLLLLKIPCGNQRDRNNLEPLLNLAAAAITIGIVRTPEEIERIQQAAVVGAPIPLPQIYAQENTLGYPGEGRELQETAGNTLPKDAVRVNIADEPETEANHAPFGLR